MEGGGGGGEREEGGGGHTRGQGAATWKAAGRLGEEGDDEQRSLFEDGRPWNVLTHQLAN
jgi:hypothetical protein